jgi:hypothetical protein
VASVGDDNVVSVAEDKEETHTLGATESSNSITMLPPSRHSMDLTGQGERGEAGTSAQQLDSEAPLARVTARGLLRSRVPVANQAVGQGHRERAP